MTSRKRNLPYQSEKFIFQTLIKQRTALTAIIFGKLVQIFRGRAEISREAGFAHKFLRAAAYHLAVQSPVELTELFAAFHAVILIGFSFLAHFTSFTLKSLTS